MSMIVKWFGAKAKQSARQGAADGLLAAAEHVLATSQPLAPVAPSGGGYLRDSGVASVDEGQLRAAVSYITGPTKNRGRSGGGNLAVVVHEDMGASHSTGQSKFLEQPLNSERGAINRIVGDAIGKKLK